MKINIFFLGLICSQVLTCSKSAKILGIFPIVSRSHFLFNQPIVKGLAAKGHNVTVIGYFQSKEDVPNYREILLETSLDGYQDWVDSIPIEGREIYTGFFNHLDFFTVEKASCSKVFALEYIKRIIVSKEKTIDLIIAEAYHIQCYHLLAHKLNATLILVAPLKPILGVEYCVGNPYYPAIVPVTLGTLPLKMNFLQRLVNSVQYMALLWYSYRSYQHDMAQFARETFDMQLPSVEELNKRTALAFYNDHFSLFSRPKSPNLIDISGIHIKEPRALPKDIADFIEGSPDGVILFSFGTSINASSIPSEKLKIISNAFSSIPQRVLWRVNKLHVTELPPNVKLSAWFPQRDILEHKNVIAFISHCGQMGLLEATYSATPVIAMPLFGDQFHNADVLVGKNVAVFVDFSTMNEDTLTSAINEITIKTVYRENMQILSKTFKDRPMSPLDEALYWSEYVLKYQGAPNLRTQAADIPLYQYLLLDVIICVSVVTLGLVCMLKYLFKMIRWVPAFFKGNKNEN